MYYSKLSNSEQKQIVPHKNNDYDWSDSTVLVVEDDAVIYKETKEMLCTTGIKILYADDGYKAIKYVHSNPQINLVLIDGNLADINVFEITREILDINPLLPVIAQTTKNKESFIKAGCVDYVNKPVSVKILFGKMSKFLPNNYHNAKIPA